MKQKDEPGACWLYFVHLHGEVRDLVQPLHVLVVRGVPQGRVAQEQAAQHVRVAPGEHLGELAVGVNEQRRRNKTRVGLFVQLKNARR